MVCIKSESFPIGKNNPNNPRDKNIPLVWNSPFIMVQIRGADGTWVPVKMIMDTGAAISVLTKATADALGFKPSMGEPMVTTGVGSSQMMSKIQADVMIGRLGPVTVDIVLADSDIIANLLGVEDLLTTGRFEMRISSTRVIIYDRLATDCGGETTASNRQMKMEEDEDELGTAIEGMLRGFSVDSDNTDWYFNY